MDESHGNAGRPQQFVYPQQQLSMGHTMPLPASSPWNVDSMPWRVASKSMENPGEVMQFHAQTSFHQNAEQKRAQLHQKRKCLNSPPLPTKQFISEERITEHFNGLHISSNCNEKSNTSFISHNEPTQNVGETFTNLPYHDYQVTAKELEKKLKNAQRITMCEEIRKLNAEQNRNAFLPHALLNRIEHPCTALVLWQRPPIIDILESLEDKNHAQNRNNPNYRPSYENETEIDDFVDNNNSCDLDLNNLRVDGMDTDM